MFLRLKKFTKIIYYLEAFDGEFGNQLNGFRIIVDGDELSQLIIRLESGQQTTELVVITRITEALRVLQNMLDAIDQMRQELSSFSVGEERSSD